MITIVPSRFAGLKIEDDDDEQETRPKKANKNHNKCKTGQQQTLPVNQNKKHLNKDFQSKKINQQKKKRPNTNDEQWKQWQEMDKELVDSTYEKDLEQALLLSKLDLEEKKVSSEKDNTEKKVEKSKFRGKKPQPMNLHQFNQMLEEKTETKCTTSLEIVNQNGQSNFFENINEQARNILRKEKVLSIGQTQTIKDCSFTKSISPNKTFISKDINLNNTLDETAKLREENSKLRQELDALKEKFKNVAAIVKHAEIKEKFDLLSEIQELKKVQEQMSSEMSRLYIELEQEKSRASQAMHTDFGRLEHKSLRSALKSVRFDERSFFKNQ